MPRDDLTITVLTRLDDAPDWVDMTRDYLALAVARHHAATGQMASGEDQLGQTVASADKYCGRDGRFVVARNADGRLVGMALLHRMSNGKGEIKRLFIRPEARRAGLARRLVARLEREARGMGLSHLYLDTTPGFPEAIALYRALGFAEADYDPASVQDPALLPHLVFMEKPLAP